jgi:ubiquinone/menaquinone biosynthesis C-methylase UbiE
MKANQKDYWDKYRKRRTPNHPVVKAFVEPKIDFIKENIGHIENIIVLDVGCGNGYFTSNFSKFSYTVGLDYSRFMLSINPCNKLIQSSALSLPFKDNRFDLVFCSNLLHHIDDPTKAIKEMKRVSRKFVIISEPNRNNPLMALFSAVVVEERGALRFSLKYLKKLMERCELKTIASCSIGSVVPNKTPKYLLKFFIMIDKKNPFAFYNIIISSK